jgi:hypothetical protein
MDCFPVSANCILVRSSEERKHAVHLPNDINVVRTFVSATWKFPFQSFSKTSMVEVYGSCSTLYCDFARPHFFPSDHSAIGVYLLPLTSLTSNTDSWIYWSSWILRGEDECGL